MTLVDFRYVPTSGSLTGISFEEQTERAFNELGQEITIIREDTSQLTEQALAVANAASSAATDALQTAQSAESAANQATEAATIATSTANTALVEAQDATAKANTAIDTSAVALSTANKALGVSGEAKDTASNSEELATEAQQDAQEAKKLVEDAINAISQISNGVTLWNEGKDYPIPALVFGSNNKLYTALQESGPGTDAGAKDPVESLICWRHYVPGLETREFDPAIGGNYDLNTFTTEGLYHFDISNTLINSPTPLANMGGFLRVSVYYNEQGLPYRLFQEYMICQDESNASGRVYTRAFHIASDLWASWRASSGAADPDIAYEITRPTQETPYRLPYDAYVQAQFWNNSSNRDAGLWYYRPSTSEWVNCGAIGWDYPSHTVGAPILTPLLCEGTLIASGSAINWIRVYPVI